MSGEQELAPAIYTPGADLRAYHVATDCLEPKLSAGDILYVPSTPITPTDLVDPDLLYVVTLDNGDQLVRRILLTEEAGKLRLLLPTGVQEQEATVISLRPVLMICPRAAHLMLKPVLE